MRAAPTRVQTHPPASASPEATKPSIPSIPGFKDPPPGKRRVPATQHDPPPTDQHPPTPPSEPGTTKPHAPSPSEVERDPLVKTVLDIFEGEIKRVHPKN